MRTKHCIEDTEEAHLVCGAQVALRNHEEWEWLEHMEPNAGDDTATSMTPDLSANTTWEVIPFDATQFTLSCNTQPLTVSGHTLWTLHPIGDGSCTLHTQGGCLCVENGALHLGPQTDNARWWVELVAIPIIHMGLDVASFLGGLVVNTAAQVGFFAVEGHGLERVIEPLLRHAKEIAFCENRGATRSTLSSSTGKAKRTATSEPTLINTPAWSTEGQECIESYRIAATAVLLRIMHAICKHLDIPFEESNSYAMLRMMKYDGNEEGDNVVGLDAHTDKSWLTLLLQDGAAGLEVEGRDASTWLPIPGDCTVVVNIGDALQAISSGRVKSKVHRAVLPKKGTRMSFPLFLEPKEWPDTAPHPDTVYTVYEL